MSAIKKLIISLIVIIGILAVALISVYIVARVNLPRQPAALIRLI